MKDPKVRSWIAYGIMALITAGILNFFYQGKYADDGTLSGSFHNFAYVFIFHFMFSPLGIGMVAAAALLALCHLYLTNRRKGETLKSFMGRYFDENGVRK